MFSFTEDKYLLYKEDKGPSLLLSYGNICKLLFALKSFEFLIIASSCSCSGSCSV